LPSLGAGGLLAHVRDQLRACGPFCDVLSEDVNCPAEHLGHASVAFALDTYAHLMPGRQAQAAAAVAALVDGGSHALSQVRARRRNPRTRSRSRLLRVASWRS
jgi:hypothetical protein